MTTAVERISERQMARPLSVLVPLIKKDLENAKDAADRASKPYHEAIAEKMVEARSQQTYSEFISWSHRHFGLKETQSKNYLSLGKDLPNYGTEATERPSSINAYQRSIGRNKPTAGYVRRDWTAPVDEIVARAQREQIERIREDALTRAQEKEAVRKLALRLIEIGFKVLAKELHPDKGGTKEAFARLKQAHEMLKSYIGE